MWKPDSGHIVESPEVPSEGGVDGRDGVGKLTGVLFGLYV